MENQFKEQNESSNQPLENQLKSITEVPGKLLKSKAARILMISFLTLALLIPLEFVKSLIYERSLRKKQVMTEVSAMWGGDIYFYGVVLKIPYTVASTYFQTDGTTAQGKKITEFTTKYLYVYPEEINNHTNIKMNRTLKRGLYKPITFSTTMTVGGQFLIPDISKFNIAQDQIDWSGVTCILRTSNIKSVNKEIKFVVNGQDQKLELEGESDDSLNNLATAKIKIDPTQTITFDLEIGYNGSNSIHYLPIGKTTRVTMDGDWHSPSFEGAYAAELASKKIDEKGFHAEWNIISVNRPFPQVYDSTLPDHSGFSFGTSLIEPVDQYQQIERVAKYGMLVIGLTFLIFLLINFTTKIPMHIFQYLMIGLALVLFYTLLLSITEHLNFGVAYLIASIATIALLALYTLSILHSRRFSVFIATSLGGLYAFIYIIIRMENYALLTGSVGLFLILAAIMYYSRKIDWSN